MRCASARETIVLRTSGDTTDAAWRAAEEHLSACASCREFQGLGEIDLVRVRDTQPLTDAELAAILGAVLAKIATPRASRLAMPALRLAFTIALVIVAGALIVTRRTTPPDAPGMRIEVAHRAPPRSVAPAAAAPVQRTAETRPARRTPRAVPVRTTDTSEIHMEIQTADPDVRIIWIANQNYQPETRSLEELQ